MKRLKILLSFFVKSEQGGVLILVAFAMIVLLGMTALAVDGGNLYQNRREMVNAADAAAMAGVQEFLDEDNTKADIEKFARDFAIDYYGCNPDLVVAEADMTEYTVWVRTGKSVDHYFAPILGIHSSDVKSEAKAVIRKVSEMENVIPIHMQLSMFNLLADLAEGTEHEFVEFHQYKAEPGNWGWVNFDKGETPQDTVDYLGGGYPYPLSVNDEIKSNTGDAITKGTRKKQVEDILEGYKEDLDNGKEGTTLYVPVTQDVEHFTGAEDLVIVGFAAIVITDYLVGGPKEGYISGKLVAFELVDQPQSSSIGGDFDLRSIYLIKID